MGVAIETADTAKLTQSHLIDDQLRNRLVKRLVREQEISLPLAERILDQTLEFLTLCADQPDKSFSPSSLVDIGWHTFILYTREYAQFCQEIAGRFIHHCPSDEEGIDYSSNDTARTVSAMRAAGRKVDDMLWADSPNSCCGDKGGGCPNGEINPKKPQPK